MARQYPRFLFSDPKNTKSKGPFVIHCLEPRLIFKVHQADLPEAEVKKIYEKNLILREFEGMPYLELLDKTPTTDKGKIVIADALEWLGHQISSGEIVLAESRSKDVG